ncbi:hypothetical protein, partial [Salmonella sp. SAL04284]|uniref:hypothetical protein n=1 Tax=Salmonella sp. SAL04284 TaxID=3159862 RepID=UPI00397B7391
MAYDALRQAGRADNAPGVIRRAESQAGEKCRMKHRALRQVGRAKRAPGLLQAVLLHLVEQCGL